MLKLCRTCMVEKDVIFFHSTTFGIRNVCKDCANEKRRKNKIKKNSRNSKKYQDWRISVYSRDGHKCLNCGSTEVLNAHHIIPWKVDESLRFDISNGMTLCSACHTRLESKQRLKNGHSEETKKKISDAKKGFPSPNKGKKASIETKLKQSISRKGKTSTFKGRKHSEEAKKKLSESRKGQRNSIDTEFKRGMTPWNKGLINANTR